MKQKPFFLKYLTLAVSIASMLIPAARLLHLNTNLSNQEGYHPKTVNLVGPLAVNCPNNKILAVGNNCLRNVYSATPTSSCNQIDSISYSIDGGSIVVVDLSTGLPDSVFLGTYGIDTIIINWFARDTCSPIPSTGTCMQTIILRDSIPPVITCPANTTVGNNIPNSDIGPPVYTDNCSPKDSISITNNRTNNSDTLANLPFGTTLICWTATDKSNNSASCCFNVTKIDNTPPNITCPTDTIKVQCIAPPPYGNLNAFLSAGGQVTDDVRLDSMSFAWVRDDVKDSTCVNKKTISRFYMIRDTSRNADTCFQTIVINDNTPPSPVCRDLTIDLNSMGTATLLASDLNNNSTDNCGGGLIFTSIPSVLSFSCDSVATSPNTVTLIVTDRCGNSATCTSRITVRDLILPTITCPSNITVFANVGQCFATNIILGVPTTMDNCPPVAGSIPNFNGNPYNGSTQLPVGTNTIVWVVTDKHNNTNSCSQLVTVRDNQLPSISCPANITINAINGTCAANVTYVALVGMDLCPGVATMQTSGLASGASFPVGMTTNVFMATDASNNTATCSFTVTVRDVQLPSISCPANITMNTAPNTCAAIVTYPAPIATDNCPASGTIQTSGFASGASFPVGVTSNIFKVTDAAGNTATCSFTVTIIDNQLPVINCPADMTVNTQIGACSATVIYPTPVGTDNCPGATTSLISGLASGMVYPLGMTVNTFRVTAANGASATCSFKVTVRDLQAPTISCPAVDSVTLNNNCKLLVPDLRSKIIRSDNCGIDTVIQSPSPGSILPSSHNQVHIFTFTVTDLGGLSASCTTTVTAKDKLGPDIVCKQMKIISIVDSTFAAARTFVDTAYDACGGRLTYKISRMGSSIISDTARFSCADVNDTIMMVILVSDSLGNASSCMVPVVVRDFLSPVITYTLPDITISCEYPLNISDLNVFGTYKFKDSARLNIVITDPGSPPSPKIVGQNGVFSENCPGSQVIPTFIDSLSLMCKTGLIKRIFTITDVGGNIIRDTQNIYVFDFNKFGMSDIIWPPSPIDYYDCQRAVPDTAVTKSPGLKNDKCSQAAATFVDQTIIHPTHCKVISRKWTVIDWCQYKTNTPNSPGKWTFDQMIVIKDTIAPVIVAGTCLDTIICAPLANCNAAVTFSASGSDNCAAINVIAWTYKIDLLNNGGNPDITGTGRTFNRTFPLGKHKLTWVAKDECGNKDSCSFFFIIKDCKAPNAIVMQGLAINIMPGMGMAIMKASDFNNFSNDNCTAANMLKYSFSSDTNDVTRTYTCDSLGKRTVEIWVTDQAGNQSKATTYVSVQDNQNACGNAGKINISGSVYTEDRVFVPDTKVTIDGGETEGESITDKTGKYSFKDLARYNNYQILPEKNTGHIDGITTLDLVIIQRHILGVKTIESPYRLIAADVNNTKSITASDLVELRKMVLGLQNEFTNNTSWRFVDASYAFNDMSQPWLFAENLQYEGLETNMTKSDFIAVKTGDVNGSVSFNLTEKSNNRSSQKVLVYTDEVNVKAGEIIAVPVYTDNLHEIAGFQWTIEMMPGLTFEGYESALLDIKNENIAVIERKGKKYLTMSFDHQKEIHKKDESPMFYLIFSSSKTSALNQLIKFSGEVTTALAVMKDEEERNVSFWFRTKENTDAEYIYQNQPNPFKNETMIHLGLKKATEVNITIFDAKGSSIYNGVENLAAGSQVISINEKHVGNHVGVFYCRIKANEVNQVIKMLRIE